MDPHTVRVSYDKPHGRALETWGMNMLPKHLLAKAVADGKLKEAPQNSTQPVGTGPYRFHEWKSGEKIVLVANPDYYRGRPYIGRRVYRVIPSQGTIFLELKARGVDLLLPHRAPVRPPDGVSGVPQPLRPVQVSGHGLHVLRLQPEGPALRRSPRPPGLRPRHRQAGARGRRGHGPGPRGVGPIRPGNWACTDKVTRYEFDVVRAKALLEEAGWKDRDGDGVVEDAGGRPFAFTIRTNQGNDERKKIAEILQQRFKDVGVKVEIQTIDWASFIKEFVKPRKFEVIVLGLGFGADPDQYVLWHSSQTAPDQMNRTGYANPEVDALLEKGRASCRQEERVKYYHRIQEILAEDLPMIFLYVRDALPVIANRVRGPDPGPAGLLWNLPEWYVPKHLQVYTAG